DGQLLHGQFLTRDADGGAIRAGAALARRRGIARLRGGLVGLFLLLLLGVSGRGTNGRRRLCGNLHHRILLLRCLLRIVRRRAGSGDLIERVRKLQKSKIRTVSSTGSDSSSLLSAHSRRPATGCANWRAHHDLVEGLGMVLPLLGMSRVRGTLGRRGGRGWARRCRALAHTRLERSRAAALRRAG
ncbi:hypothetical protein PENTCL1PPCAC_9258, partial [Pristionchus entomophagus]